MRSRSLVPELIALCSLRLVYDMPEPSQQDHRTYPRNKTFRRLTSQLAACCVALTLSPIAQSQDYALTKLPTLGGSLTRGFGVNDQGQVVGVSNLSDGNSHAFLWSRIGGIKDLGTINGPSSVAYGINQAGQVVGQSDAGTFGHAFLWTEADGMQDLGSLGAYSAGAAINNKGEVLGYSETGNGFEVHAFLWTKDTGMHDLDLLGATFGGSVAGINDTGKITGTASAGNGSVHAFTWTEAEGMRDLGTLGGPNSHATGINNSDQVTGFSDTPSGVQHAFLWTRASGMMDLGTLPQFGYSAALAINDSGEVVGSTWQPNAGGSAFRWSQSQGMKPIGPFGKLVLTDGNDVNQAAVILASRYVGVGYSSYVLSPLMNTTLSSSANPSRVGVPIELKVMVTSAIAGPPPDGQKVTITDGKAILAVLPLTAGLAALNTSSLARGTHALQATYPGDSNHMSDKSAILQQVVARYPTSVSLTSSLNPSRFGQAVTWTIRAQSTSNVAATGNVTIRWPHDGQIRSIGVAPLDANGVATLTRSNLNAATYPLVAFYVGDALNDASTSTVLSQAVLQTTSAAIIRPSSNPSLAGQSVTFTATITSPTVTANGPVTFTAGSTVLGTAQLSGGKAKLTVSTLPVGQTVVSVRYFGDSNITGSTAALTQTVK
jgi:probable HAF family extracellular repeat protein